jgi:hypothetical protein
MSPARRAKSARPTRRRSFPTPHLELAEAIAVLERTPRLIEAMLKGIPPAWANATEGRGTWSPRVVVGHLLHGEETDWIPRARLILEHGEERAFTPYDRFAQFRRFGSTPLPALIRMFQRARARNLRTLRGWRLTRRQLQLTGVHPEFGRVSLGQLLATWVAHDLGHVVQVARTMARRYQTDAGPWVRYLSVLTRR